MSSSRTFDFAYYVSKFFTEYLVKRKNASSHTILSYRDTFKLLIQFSVEQKGMRVEKMNIDMVDKPLVTDFLSCLKDSRKCGVATQNQRLAAIHSFFRYIQTEEPKYLITIQQVLSIPYQKAAQPVINFLSTNGVRILLQQAKADSKLGYRDLVLLTLMYDAGARVQEIVDLTIGDLVFDRPPYLILTGKGRKSRMVPLMKETARMLHDYVDRFPFADSRKLGSLFSNRNGKKLTRAGVSYILDKYASQARHIAPNEIPDILTPHCIRHSKAMHLLQAGVNLVYIRDFLGHNDIKTTEIYARADSQAKRKALENAYTSLAPEAGHTSWIDDKGLLDWLKSL
jgi:site-specific recombinase XerD